MLLWKARTKKRRQRELTLFQLVLRCQGPESTNGLTGLLGFTSDLLAILHLMITRLFMKPFLLTLFSHHGTALLQLRALPLPVLWPPWLPAHLSLQSVPAFDAPGQLPLAFLSPEWASWTLALMPCWSQHLQAEHHGLVPTTSSPVGGYGWTTETSCNPVGSVAHPVPTVIPSVTATWGYTGF